MTDLEFKKLKYGLKLLDISNFIKGSLSDLSKNLNDKDKIITKEHFQYNFSLVKEKACFQSKFINRENIYKEK